MLLVYLKNFACVLQSSLDALHRRSLLPPQMLESKHDPPTPFQENSRIQRAALGCRGANVCLGKWACWAARKPFLRSDACEQQRVLLLRGGLLRYL